LIFQVRSPLKSHEDELKQQVATLEATIDTMVETEKNLRDEIKSLKTQLQASQKENETLNQCVKKTEFDKVQQIEHFTLFIFVNLLFSCFLSTLFCVATLSEKLFVRVIEYI